MKKHVIAAAALMTAFSCLPAMGQATGFGTEIPLGLAVKQIVPDTMQVDIESGVDESIRVSWSGGDGWRRALDQALEGTGYTLVVEGNRVVIRGEAETVVAEAEEPAPQRAPIPTPAAPSNDDEEERASESRAPTPTPPARPQVNTTAPAAESRPAQVASRPAPQVPVVPGAGFVFIPQGQEATPTPVAATKGEWRDYTPEPAAPVIPEWTVTAGQNLQVVLEDWATQEGWRLVWETDYIYELTSPARFRGDFVAATTELLRSMQDVRPMVTAEFFQGNKVLVIGNDSFDETN